MHFSAIAVQCELNERRQDAIFSWDLRCLRIKVSRKPKNNRITTASWIVDEKLQSRQPRATSRLNSQWTSEFSNNSVTSSISYVSQQLPLSKLSHQTSSMRRVATPAARDHYRVLRLKPVQATTTTTTMRNTGTRAENFSERARDPTAVRARASAVINPTRSRTRPRRTRNQRKPGKQSSNAQQQVVYCW